MCGFWSTHDLNYAWGGVGWGGVGWGGAKLVRWGEVVHCSFLFACH